MGYFATDAGSRTVRGLAEHGAVAEPSGFATPAGLNPGPRALRAPAPDDV